MAEPTITCYAFENVPPFARGLVRDLRVRWALEELGRPYRTRLVGTGPGAIARDAYRKLQPFGQVPVIEEGGLTLFESGAIVLHLAESSEDDALMPRDPADRARTIQWMFAALNSLEPMIQELTGIDLFYAEEAWAKARRPAAEERVRGRLDLLAAALGDREYLEDRFTAGDLLMVSVLRIPRHTDLVSSRPTLRAYQERCEARPAFQKALAAQLGDFVG